MEVGADERGQSWYLSKEEIERGSPSRRDGVGAAKEAELRVTYCSFLRDVGIRLKLPQITIATAILLCHRFYLHQSHAKNEWQTVATACIFLASKIEDTPCLVQRVVIVAYETMYRKDPDAARRIYQKELLEKRKALILVGEALLLSTIRFDFNIQHPYEPLKLALKNLGISQKEVKQAAVNLINDTLRTTLFVQFKPHYIAAGSLSLAAKLHNVRLPSENGKVWWHQFNVAPRQLQDVIQQMTELFMRRSPCSAGPAIKSATTSTPTPTLLEKQQIISIPDPVLRFTYSRRVPSTPTPAPAPTTVKKQQIIGTPDSVLRHTPPPSTNLISNNHDREACRSMPVDSLDHQNSVSPARNGVHKSLQTHMDQGLNRISMHGSSEKKSSRAAPKADSSLNNTEMNGRRSEKQSSRAGKKQQIIGIADSVPRHTPPSITNLISNNHDRGACRSMPVDSLDHQNSVSSARNGVHKSLQTHMDQGLNRISMHGRSEEQSSWAAPKADSSLNNTGMNGSQSEKQSSGAAPKGDSSLNNTGMDGRRSEKQFSQAALKGGHSLDSTRMDRRLSEKSTRAAPKTDSCLNNTGMDGRRSEKQFSQAAGKDSPCLGSSGMDRRWSERSSRVAPKADRSLNKQCSQAALKCDHSLDTARMDGRWSEKPSRSTIKADRRLNSTGMDERWPEKHFSWATPKRDHSLDSTGTDGRWSKKPCRSALKADRSLNSTGMDGRWSEKHSSWSTLKADRRLSKTGMDRRWPEKQSSRAGLKTDHVYHVCSVPKDINATGVTNLIRHKRRIQEAGEHPAPIDKSDKGGWTGRQIRSVIVVETKPPSWKRQKVYS